MNAGEACCQQVVVDGLHEPANLRTLCEDLPGEITILNNNNMIDKTDPPPPTPPTHPSSSHSHSSRIRFLTVGILDAESHP